MRLVLAGGSGSLGTRLARDAVARGEEVVVLTRQVRPDVAYRQVVWDGENVGEWAELMQDAVVVNLAGELVDRPATAQNIELLTRSRVRPTETLVQASKQLDRPPRLWLQMSTLAIYGDAGDEIINENHPPAATPPQMAGVARAWEAAAVDAQSQRAVVLRAGVVLAAGTPAFERLRTLTRAGLGGRIGTGRQWVSWIHIDDFAHAVDFIRADGTVTGVVHVTAPEPVQNREMMAALRHAFERPWSPPTPRLAVRIGARVMRTDPALALTGRRCTPERLLERGFAFRYPGFGEAINALASTPK